MNLALSTPSVNETLVPHLGDYNHTELETQLIAIGQLKFRAQQIWQWLYQKGTHDFADMTSLKKDLRMELATCFRLDRLKISCHQKSIDGTQKWLLRLQDNHEIEMVFIPEKNRGTLCVSSQIGCTLTCKFCHTGTQRLVRNLTVHEIIGQILLAKDQLEDWGDLSQPHQLTHLVFMGMGEPFYNYENVVKALKTIMHPLGLNFSRRKITVSTSGVVPYIHQCGQELGVNLGISLHAANNDIRNQIIPLNKKYPIEELISACRDYPRLSNSRRITFEYVMLKDVNDSVADAKALVKLISGIPSKINLIPFNPWPNSPFECSTPEAIAAFTDILIKAGYTSPIRRPRGQDILAACGQLKSASEKQRRTLT